MEGISWTDLDLEEQRTLAMLGDGVSAEFCDPVALLDLEAYRSGQSCPIDASSREDAGNRAFARVRVSAPSIPALIAELTSENAARNPIAGLICGR